MTNNIFYWFVYFVVIFYSTRLFLVCCFAAFTLRILYVICIIYVLKFAFNVLVYDILAKHAFLLCHDFSFRRPSKTPAKRLWWSTHYIYISLHIHIYVCICIYIYIIYYIYIYILDITIYYIYIYLYTCIYITIYINYINHMNHNNHINITYITLIKFWTFYHYYHYSLRPIRIWYSIFYKVGDIISGFEICGQFTKQASQYVIKIQLYQLHLLKSFINKT